MDTFTVLNYPGSKKSLLGFIHENIRRYIADGDTLLDIFAGTCSVGYSYKKTNIVYANDSEYYAYIISKALLGNYTHYEYQSIIDRILLSYNENYRLILSTKFSAIDEEELLLESGAVPKIVKLYEEYPTIWNGRVKHCNKNGYTLFTEYYAASYFGIKQAAEIDSLRFAIEEYKDSDLFPVLLTSLYYAMKKCVFAKDGHMAQPLNMLKNTKKLRVQREKSILVFFKEKLQEFFSPCFVVSDHKNKSFNLSFEELLSGDEIKNEVDVIYADPPYTDMQYSRYYHLLNVVSKYDYPTPTTKYGQFTKGLYTDGRFQSDLSQKARCSDSFNKLISFAGSFNKKLIISFAYPQNTETQKTNRYVMSIDEIKRLCYAAFGHANVKVLSQNYSHSNNRNSTPKKVIEYLIVCNGK